MYSLKVQQNKFAGFYLFHLSVFITSTIFIVSGAKLESRVNSTNRSFPDDFLFGAATSAYQIEGGWDADGKGPSVIDEIVHTKPEKILDRSNSDVGANSYLFYEDDIRAVKNLGMNFYRFSISWSRVLPTGEPSNVNEKGIAYYNHKLNKILEHKLIPVLTIFHYDLPSALQALGGFTNEIMVEYFEAYAKLLFDRFGDRVKYWITFNEGTDYCRLAEDTEVFAPGIRAFGVGDYLCSHNVLKAHATAYHLYRNQYYDQFRGEIGISINSKFFYSATNDTETVDRALQFSLGWFLHPIFTTTGNYPDVMIKTIAENSIKEGRLRSRLPTFSPDWIEKIRGAGDFIGLNYYTSRMIETPKEPVGHSPSFERDMNVIMSTKPEWKRSACFWQYSVPEGLRDNLRFIRDNYSNAKVIITEHGWADKGEMTDDARIEYIRDHLEVILDVIHNNESNLKGYTVWSLIDNFEWTSGYTQFPDDFSFGAATSAYQIEGGWDADGKGPSIWDELARMYPEKIIDRSNGDVSANSYEFYEDDVKSVKNLGMNFYRFSIAWSRVLPTGEPSNVNEKGIDYYNRVIDKVIENKLIPMVTMFHYDLPQALQALGGFTNPILIDYFEAYSKLLFDRFGDRVKYWITFNEAPDYCRLAEDTEVFSPGIKAYGISDYLCSHNVLKAHAAAYHLYRNEYYNRHNAEFGMVVNVKYPYSATNDTETVDRALQFTAGWFLHPIFAQNGNYPEVMIKTIAENSIKEGRLRSRLPTFSPEWIKKIHGSADFIGLNYYTSRMIETLKEPVGSNPSFDRDMNVIMTGKSGWKRSACDWQYSVPEGLRDSLRFMKENYNNAKVIITEHGWADKGDLTDDARIEYIREHLEVVLDVIHNNESNLKGYTVWSLIDNFEWISGYTVNFGLYAVNMTSPRKERIPRKSAGFMKSVTTSRKLE